MREIHGLATVLAAVALLSIDCSHHNDNQSSSAKEPRTVRDSPTAEERVSRAERADEERRAEERRVDERRAEERRVDERRAEERRAEERRVEEGRADQPRDYPYVGGGPRDPASAVAKIATARCDREVRCNNVGRKEKYPSRADCVIVMQNDRRDAIDEKDCPRGIDKKQLDACLMAIRDESCGNAIDTISRLVACRSSSICVK